MRRRWGRGFTLIEIMVAISLSLLILGVVYFALVSALESLHYTRDELALQHVLSGALEDVLEGTDWMPGLRSALEVSEAREDRVGIVPTYTEEQPVVSGRSSFQLSRYVKPGAGLPAAESRVAPSAPYRPLPIAWADPDNFVDRPRLKPGYELVSGGMVRFSYHPDPDREPDTVITARWDPEACTLLRQQGTEQNRLGQNPFGVTITECRFRYYDQTNTLLTESGDVPDPQLPLITAIELQLSGQIGSHTLTLMGMSTLRNSLRHGGILPLKEGMTVPIPDSRTIQTFTLTNMVGMDHHDELQLEIKPSKGRGYRVTLRFERYGEARPVIGQVIIEYPPGNVVATDRPRTSAELGLDLLAVGPGGLYDYDDDPEVDDVVMVEGDPIVMTVTKMDLQGAACFIQP